jgi:hypothetical protein
MNIPDEEDCRVCHDAENDPNFNFTSAINGVSH